MTMVREWLSQANRDTLKNAALVAGACVATLAIERHFAGDGAAAGVSGRRLGGSDDAYAGATASLSDIWNKSESGPMRLIISVILVLVLGSCACTTLSLTRSISLSLAHTPTPSHA